MKLPLSWLKEYIDISFSVEDLSDILTMAGIEVDEVSNYGHTFQGVIVASVQAVSPHPNAERLQIAQVFDGSQSIQVVCGAPNCRPGIHVAFAPIGAKLQDNNEPWTVKKGKLRGVESFGMLCSLAELQLGAEQDGIWEVPQDIPLGSDIASLYRDTVFTLSLTPNLGHCMSIYGIARELSAFLQVPCKHPSPKNIPCTFEQPPYKIHIKNPVSCPNYSCKKIGNLHIQPSPFWLRRRIELMGSRSINNVVDISNYVLFSLGQPLHFFDVDHIDGDTIIIAPIDRPSSITTLDGEKRHLPTGTITIQDRSNLLAVGGIIGGKSSEITNSTKDILIEAAVFAPASVRATMRALGCKTDAAIRFERGVDPLALSMAIDLATELLVDIANATIIYPTQHTNLIPHQPKILVCRTKQIQNLLGIRLSSGEISDMLRRLEMLPIMEQEEGVQIQVPSYRNDVKEEVDLVEEIARLYGFHHLPKSANRHVTSPLGHAPLFLCESAARAALLQEGLQEFVTCDLISPSLDHLVQDSQEHGMQSIFVVQSKSQEYSVLRSSLLPGLLQVVRHNLDHKTAHIAGFEVGLIHFRQKETFIEQSSAGIILSGHATPYHHDPKPKSVDFFDLKGIVENLLQSFHTPFPVFTPSCLPLFQQGRQAYVQSGQTFLGILGEIHPDITKQLDIKQRVYFAQIQLEAVHQVQPPYVYAQPIPLYPASERDWTVTVPTDIPVDHILSHIRNIAPPLLEKVFLLDLFQPDAMRKNITWRFVYRDIEKTLSSHQVDEAHANLLQNVAQNLKSCIL